jgi:hypothetical protein
LLSLNPTELNRLLPDIINGEEFMLKKIIIRLIYAVISATILSLIGNYLSSKLERLPRILRDSRFSGSNQKSRKQGTRDSLETTDCKPLDECKRLRKETRPRNSGSRNQRKSRIKIEENRCNRAGEIKGQPKSQRQCHTRNGRNIHDTSVKDRSVSQRR